MKRTALAVFAIGLLVAGFANPASADNDNLLERNPSLSEICKGETPCVIVPLTITMGRGGQLGYRGWSRDSTCPTTSKRGENCSGQGLGYVELGSGVQLETDYMLGSVLFDWSPTSKIDAGDGDTYHIDASLYRRVASAWFAGGGHRWRWINTSKYDKSSDVFFAG